MGFHRIVEKKKTRSDAQEKEEKERPSKCVVAYFLTSGCFLG